MKPRDIFIVTGEPSGDLHGARLAQAMRQLAPEATFRGVGGTRMRQAGVELAMVSEHWGAIGIPEALRKVPYLVWQGQRLVHLLRASPPDALVLIDFGAFNVRLLKLLQGSGIRSIYFIPPGSWSRHRPAGRLPFLVDAIATPFPWSADNLRAAGAPARVEWVGNPIRDYCRTTIDRTEARRRVQAGDRPVVALVPGSRKAELRYLLPVFLDAVQRLTPQPLCLITVAPSLGEDAIRAQLPVGLDVRLLDGLDYDLLQAADAALVTSGTATLEVACLGLPMVVAYRGSFATWIQYKIISRGGRLRYVSLPNILLDAPAVPELLQKAASPAGLATALTPLLTDTPARRAQLAAFEQLRALLGDGHAIEHTARLVLEIASKE